MISRYALGYAGKPVFKNATHAAARRNKNVASIILAIAMTAAAWGWVSLASTPGYQRAIGNEVVSAETYGISQQ